MYRHVLVYREHAAAFFGYAGEQGAEDAGLMVEQHREHGLAPTVKLRRLKDIVLVFIIRAARDARQLHCVTHVLFFPVFKHTPHGEHFFIIVWCQDYDKSEVKRCVMLKSIGLYFRKIDFLNFAVGAIMPIIVLFIVYSSVKSNIILQDTDFLSLLMNHKGKFIFYFFVSFIEEVIFRGIIFGLLLQKCKNKYLSCVIAALIFTLPHIFNTDNISVLVMFIFPFLYGIFANEMFYTTKSIWMPTGFHWLWNYTITSLFLVTGTQSFIYVHIIAAMIIMIPLFYIVIGKTRLSGD